MRKRIEGKRKRGSQHETVLHCFRILLPHPCCDILLPRQGRHHAGGRARGQRQPGHGTLCHEGEGLPALTPSPSQQTAAEALGRRAVSAHGQLRNTAARVARDFTASSSHPQWDKMDRKQSTVSIVPHASIVQPVTVRGPERRAWPTPFFLLCALYCAAVARPSLATHSRPPCLAHTHKRRTTSVSGSPSRPLTAAAWSPLPTTLATALLSNQQVRLPMAVEEAWRAASCAGRRWPRLITLPSTPPRAAPPEGHKFEDVDLSEEWADYDDTNDISVSIMEVEHRFTVGK